jgi:transposase-like protein
MQERFNEEISRRERVIHIFSIDEAALRLISSALCSHNATKSGRSASISKWIHEMGGGKANAG